MPFLINVQLAQCPFDHEYSDILTVNTVFSGSLTYLKNWPIFKFLCIKLRVSSTRGLVHDFYSWSVFNFNHKVVWVTVRASVASNINYIRDVPHVNRCVGNLIAGETIKRYPCFLAFICANIIPPITTFLVTAKSARLVPLSLDPSCRLKLAALLIIESFFTHFTFHASNYFNVTFRRLLVRPIQSIIYEFLMASSFC